MEADAMEPGLVERWEQRQAELAGLLEACGATEGERHVEWEQGRLRWVTAGETVASADLKVLCSYAFEEETLQMAWANDGPAQGAVIAPLPDVPDTIEACGEPEAWLWAMRLAEESGAEFLYRVASPSYLVFLGLWNVLPALDGTGELESGSPQAFVMGVLDGLTTALQEQRADPAALSRLFVNRGESLLQNAQYLYGDRSDSGLVRRTGNALVEMGNSFGQRRFGLLPPAALSEAEAATMRTQLARLRAHWLRAGRQGKGDTLAGQGPE